MRPSVTEQMTLLAALMLLLLAGAGWGGEASEPLTSLWHRISAYQQGWGEPGDGVCAHAPGQTPLPMQIKGALFREGLGTHAPARLVVDLDGEYCLFQAQVGVQWQGGKVGSVVFRVFVDGKKRFDSGVRREHDPPLPVSVRLQGAERPSGAGMARTAAPARGRDGVWGWEARAGSSAAGILDRGQPLAGGMATAAGPGAGGG